MDVRLWALATLRTAASIGFLQESRRSDSDASSRTFQPPQGPEVASFQEDIFTMHQL